MPFGAFFNQIVKYSKIFFILLLLNFLCSYFPGVDFQSAGNSLSLVIYLPPDFPKDRPAILVDPRSVRHPWLREDGAVVGAPGIVLEKNLIHF